MKQQSAIIMDRHPLFRRGLSAALEPAGITCVEAQSFNELISRENDFQPTDLILFDPWQSDTGAARSCQYLAINCLRLRFRTAKLIVISDVDDGSAVARCLAMGVAGYLSKCQEATDIRAATLRVLASKTYVAPGISDHNKDSVAASLAERVRNLTVTESRVLMMICNGKFNHQIADELGLQKSTVKAHVSRVIRKLGVLNRTNAVILIESLANASAAQTKASRQPVLDTQPAASGPQ